MADPRAGHTCRGQVIFHDAFGLYKNDEPSELEDDVLTYRYPNGYMEGESPGDWQSPVPVTFLTIAAETTFRFSVTLVHS